MHMKNLRTKFFVFSRLVDKNAVERNGTADQTESSTKTNSENILMVVVIILSILLAVTSSTTFYLIYLLLKKRKCSLMHRMQRNRTSSK